MNPIRPVGRPVGEYDAKKKEIADATWVVIADRGLEGASMRAIARQAGYTTGAIVHYFENKDELLEYALEQAFERAQEEFQDALDGDDVLAAIRDIALENLSVDSVDRKIILAWRSFLSAAEGHPPLAEKIRKVMGAYHKQLTKLVQRGQDQKTIRNDFAASELADQVYALVNGLVRMASIEPKRMTPKRLKRLIDVHIETMKLNS